MTSEGKAIAAWQAVFGAFNRTDALFEVFNEPFGCAAPPPPAGSGAGSQCWLRNRYKTAEEYLGVMRRIVGGAGLPEERVVLDGTGYADSVRGLSEAGWQGAMAYHFYPNWVPRGRETQAAYAERALTDLRGLSHRAPPPPPGRAAATPTLPAGVYITEFGSDLSRGDYGHEDPDASDGGAVNALRGLQVAIESLHSSGASLLGAYYWHGWANGDSYSFWGAKNSGGAHKVLELERAQ